ncbi:transcriptional regulator cAMP-binding AadR/Crp/Fnr [Komagataeibacter xylinus NBRC 13693]|uniref:Transcriptional regulator cAMP-binding AadR/Crp/Fnr n=2 Tax=Komagataeibacter TaxID=1434011 RepID=A0A0D6Q6T9_KOMXY|nr:MULTISPECIES: helix-turn-helix domain-containing protein [Komagataeibacter]GAN99058.1 transcriptional regulator cAMP-binding AadR/Crp/Fnr [Komagataeibacter xylinus NBRC 13693]GCE78740.1 cAMP-binding transcriptional regulator [Komagataeibacter oboediens]
MERSFGDRQEFMTEDTPASMHFHVVSGGARLFKSLPDGRRQIIGFAHKGDVLPAYPCTHYHYSAEAMRTLRVACVPAPYLRHLHETSPGACAASLRTTRRLLVGFHNRLLMLGRQTARERLAAFLIGQGTRMGRGELWPVDPGISRADIADFLGLTTETVSRLLSAFHREKLISRERRAIHILDPDRLRAIVAHSE